MSLVAETNSEGAIKSPSLKSPDQFFDAEEGGKSEFLKNFFLPEWYRATAIL